MKTYDPPVTVAESDQDEAALKDNAERVADGDWAPTALPGFAANATTGTGITSGILRVGGGMVTDSLNREQTALAPVLDSDEAEADDPATGNTASTAELGVNRQH